MRGLWVILSTKVCQWRQERFNHPESKNKGDSELHLVTLGANERDLSSQLHRLEARGSSLLHPLHHLLISSFLFPFSLSLLLVLLQKKIITIKNVQFREKGATLASFA